jgi:radical SAM superfamily enzyme YgiQ (UPF0313 family)
VKHSASSPTILLVNPPVYDFVAYDLWAKPLGLLTLAAVLRQADAVVYLLDYMDRCHPLLPEPASNRYGCGKYCTEEIPKPAVLSGVPRKYHRYGLPAALAEKALDGVPVPDIVLVGSGMTYWYPGVTEAIALLKRRYPNTAVILGGIYATLCPGHARECSGADRVFQGGDPAALHALLNECGIVLDADVIPSCFSAFPAPDYSFYRHLPYAVLGTSRGCPFHCSYCASEVLSSGGWEKKRPETIVQEIAALVVRGIQNIAFYDDALFVHAEEHIMPVLAECRDRKLHINFHSPNGLHARFLTAPLANLLKAAGFVLPRLSLETVDSARQRSTGGKILTGEFEQAVINLKDAGYNPGEYVAYLLMGMPGQSDTEVEESIHWAHRLGARISLSEYSLIPGTRDWEHYKHLLPYEDPLWQNNTLLPLMPRTGMTRAQQLKDLAHKLNQILISKGT